MVTKSIFAFLSMSAAGLLVSGGVAHADLRSRQGDYEVQVLVNGGPARSFSHRGESYVLGVEGEHYTVRVYNNSRRRIETVVSVDGRDVVDGRSADYRSKRGYLIAAYSHIDIEGWRVSSGQVAAFRFSDVPSSYAGRSGSTRDVGVIGVAVFPERVSQPLYLPPRPPPRRSPYDDRYDWGPLGGHGGVDSDRARDEAPAEPSMGDKREGKAAAPSAGAMRQDGENRRGPAYRPGLGTAYGEAVSSPAHEVEFVRQSPSSPTAVLGLRYNDREGLLSMGVRVDGYPPPWDDSALRRTAEPFPNDRRYAPPPPGWNGY